MYGIQSKPDSTPPHSSQYWRRQISHAEIPPSHPLTRISHSISCFKLMLKGTGKARLVSGSYSTGPVNLVLLQAPSRKQPGRPACYPTIQTGKYKNRGLLEIDRKIDLVEVWFKFSMSRYCNYYAIFPDRLWELRPADVHAPSNYFFNLIWSPLLEVFFVTEIYLIVDR